MNIDASCIASLKELLGDDYAPIVDDFLKNSQGYIETIGAAIAQDNRAAVTAAAHPLTSSSGQFGLREVQALAKGIEHNQTLDNAGLSEQFSKLQEAYKQAVAYFRDNRLDR
ncbi:MAG: Hpt domain-containing protein [Pseudomonadota bacterium]